jgi:DNA-binding transcriptional MerR regulator
MNSISRKQNDSTIGEIARDFQVSPRALRFYESKGLLKPYRVGRDRYYSADDRVRLMHILKGRRLGFTLAEIRRMIAKRKNGDDQICLRLTRAKCIDQITLLERQKRETEEAIAELRRIYTNLYTQIGGGDDMSP